MVHPGRRARAKADTERRMARPGLDLRITFMAMFLS
jgi:hypothetical protein